MNADERAVADACERADRERDQRIASEVEVARLRAVLARIRREVALADPRAAVDNAPPVPDRSVIGDLEGGR